MGGGLEDFSGERLELVRVWFFVLVLELISGLEDDLGGIGDLVGDASEVFGSDFSGDGALEGAADSGLLERDGFELL